jgi:hypothetical protein
MKELSKKHIRTIKDAAHKLTGAKRRAFEAQVTLDYLGGSARTAETVFGWYRETVELGLNELRTGIEYLGNFSARGRDKTEEKLPQLEEDIRSLVEPESQTDPKFQTPFKYTRITARGLREALIEKKGWKSEDLKIRQLVINLDNGPDVSSSRTQFIKRMVEFATDTGLEIVRAYYPPYHSKYNPIERCWGILEMHWNGALLDSVQSVLKWAGTMTWKGIKPAVHLVDKVYHKGVSVAKKAFKKIEARLQRHEPLPKYGVRIEPAPA